MKAILLPTDFSKNSLNAIKYAISMFQNTTCNFYLLNVQKASAFISDDMMVMSASTTIYETLISASKKSIDNVISKIKAKHLNDKHQFHAIVDYDNLIDSINQTSKIHHIDLIVMGTKGATGLEKTLFGSNTVHVMQRCHVPILAIPDKCVYSDLDDITFTTSFQTLYEPHDLKPLKSLVDSYNSHLRILHVFYENNFAVELDKDVDFFNTQFKNVTFECIKSDTKDFFETVRHYILKSQTKMLAMVNKNHSFLERLFNRHSVETFAFSIDIPFLVIPKKD
jgi:nucleotide-binding universal stress UspA family protein